MTVITTLVTSHFTAHASDSFLTVRQCDGTRKVVESNLTKIVPVKCWRGAMSYWGWATGPATNTMPRWSTLAWLREQAQQAGSFESAGDFAVGLAQRIQVEINCRPSSNPLARGIGIHFSCYERIGDYWVPEVFIISNFEDPSYKSLYSDGVRATRNLHAGLAGISNADVVDVDSQARLKAYQRLLDGLPGWRHNGDPQIFGPFANAFLNAIDRLDDRGNLALSTWQDHADLARMPVELIIKLFEVFSIKSRRVVGGKSHDLVISPTGDYNTTTRG